MTPEEFRAAHAANPERCCDDCPGWCVSEGSDGISRIERCDECWHGRADVTDEDAKGLPEARSALADAVGYDHENPPPGRSTVTITLAVAGEPSEVESLVSALLDSGGIQDLINQHGCPDEYGPALVLSASHLVSVDS